MPHAHRRRRYDGRRVWPSGVGVSGGGSPVAPPSTLLDGLTAYWALSDANDSTANAINLTNNNAVTFTAGKVGNAATFVAASSQSLTSAAAALLPADGVPFEIAGWFKATDIAAGAGVWGLTSFNGIFELHVSLTGGSRITWAVTKDDGAQVKVTPTDVLSSDTWYFIDGYYDPDNDLIGVAINGGAFQTAAFASPLISNTDLFRVGSRFGGNYFGGQVDELAYYNGRLLTTDERSEMYNAGAGTTYPF